MSLRDLKIKTGVVKRIGKELSFYEQELQKQQARIDGLVASGADIHDVRKQTEVLKETQDIFPDVRRRLQTSHAELSELVDFISKQPAFEGAEELTTAQSLLSEIVL